MNPITSPSLSFWDRGARSPLTLNSNSFAFRGDRRMIFSTSPTVLPSSSYIQERSSRALRSHP